MRIKERRVPLVDLCALLPLSACPSDERNAPSSIAVLTDSSLKAAFSKLAKRFESEKRGPTVTFTYGEFDSLAQKAAAGETGDLLTTNDRQTMDSAQTVQLGYPETFATINLLTGPTGQQVLRHAGFAAP